jgi:mannosyltransferase OCH1-like enzyme
MEQYTGNIPKIAFSYWSGNQFTLLNYYAIETFLFYNPDFEFILYLGDSEEKNYGGSGEHNFDLNNCSVLSKIKDFEIKIINFDFSTLNFGTSLNNIIKADIMRIYGLKTHGGFLIDLDIFFIKSIKDLNIDKNTDAVLYYYSSVFPTGFLGSKPNYYIYINLYANILANINETNYQSVGPGLFNKILINNKVVKKTYNNVQFINEITIYPYKWNNIAPCYDQFNVLNNTTIGIHWFNGSNYSRNWIVNNQDTLINCDKQNTTIEKLLYEFKQKKNNIN